MARSRRARRLRAGYPPGPGLYLATLGVLLLTAAAVIATLWYLAAPRFAQWAAVLPAAVLAAAGAVFAYFLLEYVALVLTVYTGRDLLFPLGRGRRASLHLTPVAKRVACVFGAGGDRLIHSFVQVSNAATRAQARRMAAGRTRPVLVLLPRCLQRPGCPEALADDVESCRRCGRCAVAAVLGLRDEYETS